MSGVGRLALLVAVPLVLVWLAMGFIALDWNVAHWSIGDRAATVIVAGALSFIAAPIVMFIR